MGRISTLFGLFLSLALLVGCTRKLDQESKVSFDLSQFKKIGASAVTERISFVAVNVTASDMPRKVFIFDAHDQCIGECRTEPSVPSRVELDVTPGAGRLIQVLLIVESEDSVTGSESETFKYGDLKKDLAAGDNPITVSVSPIAGSTNKEGNASGRYLFSDGKAFTGPVTMEFTPPNGRPNMEIFRMEMFSGWFGIHLLDNIGLTYRMANGHVLFGGPVSQQSTVFNGSAAVKKIGLPARFEVRGDPNSTDSFLESRAAEMMSIGFWQGGVPDTSKTVCHDTSVSSSEGTYLDAAKTNPLDWPAEFSIAGSRTCAATDPLISTSQMAIDGKVFSYGGGDAPLFRGPYMKFLAGGSYYDMMQADYNQATNSLTVSWKYLPGVINSQLVGSTIFFKTFQAGDQPDFTHGPGGLDCDRLNGEGFTGIKVDGNTQTVSFNAGTNPDSGKVIICPRKADGTHFRTAIESHCLGNCGGGGPNNGPEPATKLVLLDSYSYLNNSACVPIRIEAQKVDGFPGDPPANGANPYTINLGHNLGANGDFYMDPDCTSGGLTSVGMFGPGLTVYFKGTTNTAASLTVSSDPAEINQLTAAVMNVGVQTPAANDHWAVLIPPNVFTTECTPFLIQLQDSNNIPVAAGTTYSFSAVGGTNGAVYSDPSCVSTVSAFGFSSPKTQREFFFKPVSTGAASIDGTEPTLSFSSFPVTVQDPGPAQYALLEGPGSVTSNTCTEFRITTYVPPISGSQSPRANVPAAISYNLLTNDPNGKFFPGPSSSLCSGGTGEITSVGQAASTFEVILFYKTTSSGGSFTLGIDETTTGDPQFDASTDVLASP